MKTQTVRKAPTAQRFNGLVYGEDAGRIAYTDEQGYQVGARLDLLLIREAWSRGCSFEDLADGFGKGLGTMGGDWSGIRDSSDEATARMLERALNHHFGKAVR